MWLMRNIPAGGFSTLFYKEVLRFWKVATQTVDVPDGISAKKDKKSDAAVGKKSEPQKDAGKKQPAEVKKPSSVLSRMAS